MKPTIAISVVIPAYNEEQLLSKCLKSLTNQDFHLPFEIIVVDNNSRDKSNAIAQSFGVKVIKETNQGVVWARQKGLLQAQGEIIAQADADCYYPSNWLSLIYKHFSSTEVTAVGGPAAGELKPYWAYLIYKFSFILIGIIYKLTGYVIYLGGFNLAFKREKLLQLGGYHTYLDSGGDEWDILWRLQKIGKVVFEPKAKIKLSTRRYRVGFVRFWLIHAFYYYVLNFVLAKIFKHRFIYSKAIRNI